MEVGIGVIVENHFGEVIFAVSVCEINVQQPEIIESLAIIRGFQLCVRLGISQLIIESDCQFNVNELQGIKDSFSHLGNFF